MVGCRRGHASIKVVGIYKEALGDFLSVPTILRLTSHPAPLLLLLPVPLRVRETKRTGYQRGSNSRAPLIFHGSQLRGLSMLSRPRVSKRPILTDTFSSLHLGLALK